MLFIQLTTYHTRQDWDFYQISGIEFRKAAPITFSYKGDTIKWLPTNKGHNVEFLGGPDGFELPAKSGLNKEVSITFDKPGVYLYVCTPHKVMGMIALVVVGGDTSNKDAISKVKMMGRGTFSLGGS